MNMLKTLILGLLTSVLLFNDVAKDRVAHLSGGFLSRWVPQLQRGNYNSKLNC